MATHLTVVRADDGPDPYLVWRHRIDTVVAEMRKSHALEPYTIDQYVDIYERWLTFLAEQAWRKPDQQLILDFARRPRGIHNGRLVEDPRPRTVHKDKNALSTLWEWMLDMELIEGNNPCRKLTRRLPKITKTVPVPIDPIVWLQVWNSQLSMEERVWLSLGYYVGLRRYELHEIGPDEFDLSRRWIINFLRKGGDTDLLPYGSIIDVTVLAHPHLGGPAIDLFYANLAELVERRRGEQQLFPRAEACKDSSWVNRDLKSILRRVGLAPTTLKPHDLRRSATDNMLAAMEMSEVAAVLSHHNTRTTAGYTNLPRLLETRAEQLRQDRDHGRRRR